MNPIEDLKAVLCDPEGVVCINGSDEDRRIIQESLSQLESVVCSDDCPFKTFKDS